MQAEGLQLHKKKTPIGVFSCEICEILRTLFLTEHLRWLLLSFFKKVLFNESYLTAISQPCYDVLIIFSSRHIVWCIKSRTRLFINLPSIVGFLNNSARVYPIKLKIGMLDHMNNTFRNTVFQISVDVPLIWRESLTSSNNSF